MRSGFENNATIRGQILIENSGKVAAWRGVR
jgi:hypothetical protein